MDTIDVPCGDAQVQGETRDNHGHTVSHSYAQSQRKTRLSTSSPHSSHGRQSNHKYRSSSRKNLSCFFKRWIVRGTPSFSSIQLTRLPRIAYTGGEDSLVRIWKLTGDEQEPDSAVDASERITAIAVDVCQYFCPYFIV